MSTPSAAPRSSLGTFATLLGSALAMSGLAIYQWVELLTVRAGGRPTCAINETVNCATVWDSPFASRVHEVLGMPVAGLGLVWGLTATALALLAVLRRNRDTQVPAAALKLWAAGGTLTVITLLTASLRLGAVCPTCIATYLLVLVYEVAAFITVPRGLWPDSKHLIPGFGWCAAVGAAVFLALLYPGHSTPKANDVVLGGGHETDEVMAYLNNLPPRDALATSAARDEYLRSPQPDLANFTTRARLGPADAPVRIVDFTDILCGHCRSFESLAHELFETVPKGKLSVEPRYFPLDGQCNRQVARKGTDNIRCLGAKVQICLETSPKFWEVRRELFENQQTLNEEKILQIALKSGMSRDDLLRCVGSYETQAKIDADVAFAMLYGIDGTPLVLVNGRRTLPVAPFLLGMALSGGNVNAPYFQKLPPPPPEEQH